MQLYIRYKRMVPGEVLKFIYEYIILMFIAELSDHACSDIIHCLYMQH